MKISIISFNTLGAPLMPHAFKKAWNIKKRFTAFAKELEKKDATIVALQEVVTYAHLMMLKKHLKSYPYIVYEKHMVGPKGGLVFFSKIPLEKVTYKRFRILGQFRNRTFVYKILRNGMLICKIPSISVYLIHTHTVANFDHVWSEKNKYTKVLVVQLQEIEKAVKEAAKVFSTVFVVGDLNVDKNTSYYELFTKNIAAKNVFADNTATTLQPELQKKGFTPKIIDYIFLKSQEAMAEVLNAQYLFTKKHRYPNGKYGYLSDHVALHAQILLKKDKRA